MRASRTSRFRSVWCAVALLAAACGHEDKQSGASAEAPAGRAEPDAPAALPAPAIKPLPARGQAVLHYAAGVVDVDAYAAPRRPLLEQLAHDAGFTLDA